MKTKYYYIHGLGSSKNSSKFLELKKQYPNIECLDWKETDNMYLKFESWLSQLSNDSLNFDNICIIASSTGCNFAYQIRNFYKSSTKEFIHLVLINPLFNVNYLSDINIIPNKLNKFLMDIRKITESLILIGAKDTIINHNKYLNKFPFVKNNNQIIVDYESTHKFENLNLYYDEIDSYINSLNI